MSEPTTDRVCDWTSFCGDDPGITRGYSEPCDAWQRTKDRRENVVCVDRRDVASIIDAIESATNDVDRFAEAIERLSRLVGLTDG